MLGAPARYLTDRAVQARHDSVFPWGTFTVNLVGCLILGGLTAAAETGLSSQVAALVGTGFCGGLTTYSTFSYETLRLTEQKAWFHAGMYVLVTVVAGLGAAALSYTVVRAV